MTVVGVNVTLPDLLKSTLKSAIVLFGQLGDSLIKRRERDLQHSSLEIQYLILDCQSDKMFTIKQGTVEAKVELRRIML